MQQFSRSTNLTRGKWNFPKSNEKLVNYSEKNNIIN